MCGEWLHGRRGEGSEMKASSDVVCMRGRNPLDCALELVDKEYGRLVPLLRERESLSSEAYFDEFPLWFLAKYCCSDGPVDGRFCDAPVCRDAVLES